MSSRNETNSNDNRADDDKKISKNIGMIASNQGDSDDKNQQHSTKAAAAEPSVPNASREGHDDGHYMAKKGNDDYGTSQRDEFHSLATAAPKVEAAVADKVLVDYEDERELARIEPAKPSERVLVEAAMRVEPAVTFDNPKQFAPKEKVKEQLSTLSVQQLRSCGPDFESKAGVIRGRAEKNILQRVLPLFYDERNFVSMGEVHRYVFVKANSIIVYGQETDPSPLYAVATEDLVAIQEDPKKPDKYSFTVSPTANNNQQRNDLVTILVKDRKTLKQAYQFTFDICTDKTLPKRFMDAVNSGGKKIVQAVVMKK